MNAFKTFEELEAWKACREYRVFVARNVFTQLLNKKEYSLLDQLKRSARSTTHNIAEGFGRYHYLDNYKFCAIARGSLNESLDQIICANDELLLDNELLIKARTLHDQALKILNGYMSYLQRANKSK